MIYSKKHDFLFIKGFKVAGTSLEMALSCVCGPEDIITLLAPIEELEKFRFGGRGAQNYSDHPKRERVFLEQLVRVDLPNINSLAHPKARFRQHMTLRQFEIEYGSIPTQRVFCIERSPYAKVISASNTWGRLRSRYRMDGQPMEFDLAHVQEVIQRKVEKGKLHIGRNIEHYRSGDGAVRLRVLRYEDLPDCFNALMAEFGISPAPVLPHAKRGANASKMDPRQILTEEQIHAINHLFAEEFETFGYERIW